MDFEQFKEICNAYARIKHIPLNFEHAKDLTQLFQDSSVRDLTENMSPDYAEILVQAYFTDPKKP